MDSEQTYNIQTVSRLLRTDEKFEEVVEDGICPICKHGADSFERLPK